MFRPLIAVLNTNQQHFADESINIEECSKPVEMPLDLVVPIIDGRVLEQKKRSREIEHQERARKQMEKVQLKEEAENTKRKLEQEKRSADEERKKAEKFESEKNALKKKSEGEVKQVEIKKEEPVPLSRKSKKAQKYNNKKSADAVKKSPDIKEEPPKVVEKEPSPIVEIQKAEEVESKEIIEEIVIPPPEPVESLTEVMEKVDLNIEEVIMEVPVVEENLRLSVELPLDERKIECMDLPSTVEVVEKIVTETPLEQPPVVEAWPDIIAPKPEPEKVSKKFKKGKKKFHEQQASKSDESPIDDFPPLEMPSLSPIDIEVQRETDKSAILKISMHESIDDDDIQIIPHEESVVIHENSPDLPKTENKDESDGFVKNVDFYDIDDELPPLEPFTFEGDEKCEDEEKCDEDEEYLQKQEMKSKMSKLLKDTNMVFAMCSSLKELSEGEASLSSSSHIQRSTSSSLTTNTTTATFASASSNAVGEGHDSDYKSLDLELEETAAVQEQLEFKLPPPPLTTCQLEKEDPEDISSFEATSSETDADDSSKKLTVTEKFVREDDEELRPLLDTSITSLSSPVDATTILTTEANATSTLPETNQKSQTITTNTSNNGKRKNKKKKR